MGFFTGYKRLFLLAACTLMCAALGNPGDDSVFEWTTDTGSEFTQAQVYWDFMEIGAPLIVLQSSRPHKEMLKTVEIAFAFAELPPGDYEYGKSSSDTFEHNSYVEGLPQKSVFHFEEKHLKLIRAMSVRHSFAEDGQILIGVDPKRPYGDLTYFEADMASVLGLPVGHDEQNHAQLEPAVESEMSALHLEMAPAVQVFLRQARMQPGRFKDLKYGAWERL